MLKEVNKDTLLSLKCVVEQLSKEDYMKPLKELSNSSLGKHVRHILDFYNNLLTSGHLEVVNYDNRNRGSDIETNKLSAIETIDWIIAQLNELPLKRRIRLEQLFNNEQVYIDSTLARELLYNLEHAIHHMALIRVGINLHFDYVVYSQNFGVAYSTLAAVQAEQKTISYAS